ncbi:MAG TPA: hypothetical protein VHY20_00305 [Pirellulales bacterium]|jgi:hypothetical protein|nr:hypothetical protein [Pirellulales bacterium]
MISSTKTASAASAPKSKIEILNLVATGQLSADDAAKLLGNSTSPSGRLTFKVSEKGAVSIYGMSARFPTTLYVSQLQRLFAQMDELKEFVAAQDKAGKLSRKE